MPETINLPAAGPVKKQYVYLAGAGAAGILGVAWWRKRQAASQAASTAAAPSLDPNAVDPATGLTYAEEASAQGGYMYGSVGYTTGQDMTGFGAGSEIPPIFPGAGTSPSITTNEQWVQEAEGLNLGGVSADTIAAALTKILGGLPVTQDQADIFHEVVGQIQAPPQGYPPIRLVTTPPPGTTVPPPAPPVISPFPTGSTIPAAPSGLHVVSKRPGYFHIVWKDVTQATSYQVQVWSGGRIQPHGQWTTTATSAQYQDPSVTSGRHYTVYVSSEPGGKHTAIGLTI
jgi:hypothetical protein